MYNMGRFAQVGNFASYARCVDGAHYAYVKKKRRRQHQKWQCQWAFIEAADLAGVSVIRPRHFFDKKKTKTNSVVDTKELAHELARASYHILKEKQPFYAKRCFA